MAQDITIDGASLEQARKSKRLSRPEALRLLDERFGIRVSIDTIGRWERGENRVPADALEGLVRIYRVARSSIVKVG